MSEPDGQAQQDWPEGVPERLYVVTAGRNRRTEHVPFDLVTLVVSRGDPRPGMQPEQVAILRLCVTPLSVVEISAHLSLPASTVTLLIADLVDSRHVEVRAPAAAAARADAALLEKVINGLANI